MAIAIAGNTQCPAGAIFSVKASKYLEREGKQVPVQISFRRNITASAVISSKYFPINS
jgi:hypothetical protein